MQEILALVAEGKTPEDVRQIDDRPPNPDAPVVRGDQARPLKPWERTASHAPKPTLPHPAPSTAPSASSPVSTPPPPAAGSEPQKKTTTATKGAGTGLPIYTVDSFTDEPFSGNPAGVCLVPPRAELSELTMKRIAREMNLSETAFVQPLLGGTPSKFRLRWFTPTTEVHLCGHATLATAHVLFTEVGMTVPELTFDSLSGELVVKRADGGGGEAQESRSRASPLLRMDFPCGKPQPCRLPDAIHEATLRALGLSDNDLVWHEANLSDEAGPSEQAGTRETKEEAQCTPMMVVCPVTKKLFIEIVSLTKLLELKPNTEALLAIPFEAANLPVRGISVMVHGGCESRSKRSGLSSSFYADTSCLSEHAAYDFLSRYFSPWNGINEDPVNGSSHAALVVYWSQQVGCPSSSQLPLGFTLQRVPSWTKRE